MRARAIILLGIALALHAMQARAEGISPSVTVPVTATRQSKTVSTLPTCNASIEGQMYFVTDALLPTILATVAGGGAVHVGVTCLNGIWIVQ